MGNVGTSQQTIPTWIGFKIRTCDLTLVSDDIIEFLPTINALAIDLSTILNMSEQLRYDLSLKAFVVVLDQALNAKTHLGSTKLDITISFSG